MIKSYRLQVVLITSSAAIGGLLAAGNVGGQERTGASQPLSAQEVLDRVRQTIAAISSIEYEFEMKSVGAGATSNTSKYGQSGHFAYAEGKFSSEYIIQMDNEQYHRHTAFDGEFYQNLTDNRLLHVNDRMMTQMPYGAVEPILRPCIFLGYDLARGLRVDLETYGAPVIWQPIQEKATLESPRQVAGHDCVVVKFERSAGSRKTIWELCAATDLDYYPVHLSYESSGQDRMRRNTTDVVEFADLKTAKGRVIIPLRIESISRDNVGTQMGSEVTTINKQTLKVNEPIASERFYLKRLMPEIVSYAFDMPAEKRERYERGLGNDGGVPRRDGLLLDGSSIGERGDRTQAIISSTGLPLMASGRLLRSMTSASGLMPSR